MSDPPFVGAETGSLGQIIRNVYFGSINQKCRYFSWTCFQLYTDPLKILPFHSALSPMRGYCPWFFRDSEPAFTSGCCSFSCTSSPFNHFRPLGYFGPAFRHFPWGRMPSTVILRGSARPFHCFETIKFISKTSSWLTNTLGKLDRVTIPVIAKGISLSLSFRIYKLGVVTLGLLQDAVGVTGEKCVEALCQCYCCA